jgi:DNA-binding HxlR family transcriptional regulator
MIPPSYLVGTAAVTENLLKRKWSAVILRHLANGITDPSEIGKLETDLSPKAMNERLRNMLRFCLITRYPGTSNAKLVEYRLTARGHRILKVLNFIDQLDQEASHQDQNGEERMLVTIRRTKVAADAKRRILLKD